MEQLNKGKAVASMVLGIISIVTSFVPVIGLGLGVLAITFYKKANKLINENPKQYGGHGMAIAGLVTGIIGIVLGVIYLIYWIFIIRFFKAFLHFQ